MTFLQIHISCFPFSAPSLNDALTISSPMNPMIEFSTLCLLISLVTTLIVLITLGHFILKHCAGDDEDFSFCDLLRCCGICRKEPNGAYHTVCLEDEDLEAFLDRPYD